MADQRSSQPRAPRRLATRAAAPALLVAVGLLAAGCGGSGGGQASAGNSAGNRPSGTAAGTGAATGTTLALHTTRLGSILTDGAGRTVYLFEKDHGTTSSCSGDCAVQWPPVLTTSPPPPAATGVNAALVGTTRRSDGTTELTYHGHALYYFADDHQPGDTNGQGLQTFGGGWDVLSAAGQKIEGGR